MYDGTNGILPYLRILHPLICFNAGPFSMWVVSKPRGRLIGADHGFDNLGILAFVGVREYTGFDTSRFYLIGTPNSYI